MKWFSPTECGQLQTNRKALNAIVNDDSEDAKETSGKDSKLLAFTASHNDLDESYYSESSDDEDLEEVYKKF
jgi:hypothetical protein